MVLMIITTICTILFVVLAIRNIKKEEKMATETVTNTESKTTAPSEEKELVINPPLFLAFAEYLGFVSGVIKWVDDWCAGKKIEDYKKSIIRTDALNIYHEIKKYFTDKEIKEWYDEFYEIILFEYDENIKKAK